MRAGIGPTNSAGGLQAQDGFWLSRDEVRFVIDLNPALVADITDIAVGESLPLIHDSADAIGVKAMGGGDSGGITAKLFRIRQVALGLKFDWPRVVTLQDKLHLIGIMASHVSNDPFSGVPEVLPGIHAGRHERTPWGLAQPHFVIPALGGGHGLVMRDSGSGPDLHFHGVELADATLLDHIAGEPIGLGGASLSAGLIDGAKSAASIDQRASFLNGQ